MSEMVKLTGLWKAKDKDGKAYMSGNLGSAKILIFPNGFKKEEKHPDYIVYIAPNEKKESKPAAETDDDLPF